MYKCSQNVHLRGIFIIDILTKAQTTGRMSNLPTTKKEGIYFGLMMCTGMVIVMGIYNMILTGMLGEISFIEGLVQLLSAFIVALLLDLFLVGPFAKKIALSLPFDKSKKIYMILSISFFMVLGMVIFMSLYGVIAAYLTNGLSTDSFLQSYLSTVAKNFALAFPLQLIVMGPLVRFLFMKFVKGETRNIAESV